MHTQAFRVFDRKLQPWVGPWATRRGRPGAMPKVLVRKSVACMSVLEEACANLLNRAKSDFVEVVPRVMALSSPWHLMFISSFAVK